MNEKSMTGTPYSRAYAAWFSEYDAERRRQHKRKGAHIASFPEPPASPERIAEVLEIIGPAKALAILEVHRSTVARWLSGQSVIPRPAWLLLVMLAEGRLPGMSADWRDFRFDGDTLCLVGTRYAYTARELAGLPLQAAHARALARRVIELEEKIDYLLRVGEFEAQNDALMIVR